MNPHQPELLLFWAHGGLMATYQQYEYLKQAWLLRHPDATPDQIDRALQSIARRLGL